MSLFSNLASSFERVWRPGSAASSAIANQAAERNITASQIRQTSQSQLIMPTGAVLPYAGTKAPAGFLLCDGREYRAANYPNLFDVLQYNFGGSGTLFNVPDLRGRVIVAPDKDIREDSSGRLTTDDNWFGASGGDEEHTLTVAEMPSHDHDTISGNPGVVTNMTWGTINNVRNDGNTTGVARNLSESRQTTPDTSNTGGGGAHNNLQPYLVLNYIIRY